jgi:lantibiotic modifying enzyme
MTNSCPGARLTGPVSCFGRRCLSVYGFELKAMKRSALESDAVARMLAGLASCKVTPSSRDPLNQLCSFGTNYGWRALREMIISQGLVGISGKARTSVREQLGRTLESITRPCFELEWTSYTLAARALGLGSVSSAQMKKEFLGARPAARLFSLFRKFPVLAELWSIAINQWRDHVREILLRAARDEQAIAHRFFGTSTTGHISDLRLGLSDRHLGGRTVALVEFEKSRVVYKPRSGTGEIEWASLLRWMNRHGFKPRLKEMRILRRNSYHWMEYAEPNACDNAEAVRHFYERLGGMIAAAYLLNAVDCHRDNLIACGEHPVLIDIDALWHVSPLTRTASPVELLYRTGFFPNADRTSLQSRSSVLGKAGSGAHLPRTGAQSESAADYVDEIVAGFDKGWRCLVGTSRRRAAFFQRRRRIRSRARRWIHRATESYAGILRASLQPSALTSPTARRALLRRLAKRHSAGAAILRSEIQALARLDIPYFVRRTNERTKSIAASPPAELGRAIRKVLERKKPAGRGG